MQGYWKLPHATTDAIRDGWLHTGDLGRMDREGYLFLVDRLKDLIIVAGQNVYPAEVERVLMRHSGVKDVVVYGRRHELAGEIVCASVIPSRGTVATADLRTWCAENLASYKVPSVIDYVSSIPIGPTGKKLRRLLAAPETRRPSLEAGRSDK